jgi:raffinose/stachyose/melibiose transport system permease protein
MNSYKRIKIASTFTLFLLPALVLYLFFVVYPVGNSFYYSLTNWDGLNPIVKFIGFDNFKRMFQDTEVIGALKTSMIYVFFVAILQNMIALLLAVSADRYIRLKTLFRSIIFIPALLSPLSIGYIWSYIYQPTTGVLNSLLKALGLTALSRDWLGNPDYALGMVIFVSLWQYVGINMLIYLAGLQAVPTSLYEAADIDGTTGWGKFVHITFPLIAPSLTINLVLSAIGGLKTFDLIFVMTGGGPGYATQVLSLVLYKKAFMQNSMGYGTAIAVLLFIIILLITLAQLFFLRKREVEL